METITNRTLLFGLIYHYALEIFQVLVVVVSGGAGTQNKVLRVGTTQAVYTGLGLVGQGGRSACY